MPNGRVMGDSGVETTRGDDMKKGGTRFKMNPSTSE